VAQSNRGLLIAAGSAAPDKTVVVAHGSRERALRVAEQLAFHQLIGNRSAVDRHEGALQPRAPLVNQPRDYFLPPKPFSDFANAGRAGTPFHSSSYMNTIQTRFDVNQIAAIGDLLT